MRNLIRKILKENDDDLGWVSELSSDLPFEISSTPMNKPKLSNVFRIKSAWLYNEMYLTEEFDFYVDDQKQFETFFNVCKFYSALLSFHGYDRWKDVSEIAKRLGLGLGSYDNEELYGTPKDMSDFIIGHDYPADLERVQIIYYDKGGVEYGVRLKN